MEKLRLYAKIVLNLVIALITVLIIIFVIPRLLSFFMPFVIAWIIAMIANPVVKFMEKRIKIVRKHGSAIIIVVVLAAITILFILVLNTFARELRGLMNDIPEIYSTVEDQLYTSFNKIYDILPSNIQNTVDSIGPNLVEYVKALFTGIKAPTINDAGIVVKNVAEMLFMFIITIISSYFIIAERENLVSASRRLMPGWITEKFNMISDNFKIAVGGYFKAQFKIMIIIMLILFVGFELLGVDYSFLLAFLIAFLDFLPVFGTGTVIWPWALVQVLVGNYMRAVTLMILYFICQIVKQVLQPKMVGDSIGMNPLTTLFFMFVGYKIGGILGLIIGIPVGMIIINFYNAGVFDSIIKSLRLLVQDINDFRKL